MKSDLSDRNFAHHPPRFSAAIVASRPDGATSFRLKNVDGGRYFPSLEQPASICSSSFAKAPADLVAGTYEIVYYREPRNPDTVLPHPEDRDAPQIQVSQDAVLLTPADFEIVEQRRWQKYERKELALRHNSALVQHVEQLTKVNSDLTANAIERDVAVTDLFKKFSDLQGKLTTLQETMIDGFTKQTEAINKNLISVVETAQQSISKIKTDNPYSLGSEVVKSLGAVLQAKIASDVEAPRDRRLRGQEPPRVALEGRRSPEGSETKTRRTDEPPPPPPPPAAPPSSPAASAGATAKPLPVVEIDWLDVCDRQLDPHVESPVLPAALPTALPAAAPAVAAPLDEREACAPASTALTALTAVPDELSALVAQVPELEALLASLGIVTGEVIVKPADWSYRWAWQAIKRRIARLSDSSIAWLLSSFDNALGFLRELADLATPPPNLDEAEGAS